MSIVPKFVYSAIKPLIKNKEKQEAFKEKYIITRRNIKSIYNPFNYFDFPLKKRKFWKSIAISCDISTADYPKHKILQKMNSMKKGRYFIPHPVGVVIGGSIDIGDNVAIYQNTSIAYSFTGKPTIKDNATIYANCVVAGKTVIGNGSIIGAGSVVIDKIVPDNEVWAGNPAKFIKKLNKAKEF